jgi:predicted CXXCH cytochrome family protein
MKFRIAIGLIVAFTLSSSPEVGAGTACITGGPHDLAKYGLDTDHNGNACEFCHIPHNAIPGGAMFNREVSQTRFSPYQWVAPPNTPITIDDPLIGESRLCMSCHDGVTAIAMVEGSAYKMPSEAVIGNGKVDMTVNHPIGFSYDDAMAQRTRSELVDKEERFATTVTISQTTGVYNQIERKGRYRIVDTLYQGQYVTCGTCHNVHGCSDDSGYLLRAKETNSLICLSCHIK